MVGWHRPIDERRSAVLERGVIRGVQRLKRSQVRKMIGLCAGDRDLAARLLGTNVVILREVAPKRERPRRFEPCGDPWDIDWSDCALAQRYGVS